MILFDRTSCLKDVAGALSRYNGHTTFVRLERILALPLSDDFSRAASVYASQLIASSVDPDVGKVAARRYIEHALALGFLYRATKVTEQVRLTDTRRKISSTSRLALSPLARALRASNSLGNSDFREFLITCSLLQYDFDMYGLILKTARTSSLVPDAFFGAFRQLLHIRRTWFDAMDPQLQLELAGTIPWINHDISDTSLSHHFNLRRSWAIALDHLSHIDFNLTDLGRSYAARLPRDADQFWLTPSSECIEKLRLHVLPPPTTPSTSWELLAPSTQGSNPTFQVVDAVAHFMLEAFDHLRMHLFRQAPVTAVIPFVYYAKYKADDLAAPFDILQAVIKRGSVDCMLSRAMDDCYYQVRTRNQRA